jgi:hypothetical protein
VGGDVPIDSETLLVTNFVNLKVKPAQSFGGAHRGRVCMRVFIGVSAHTCMSIYVCTMFLNIYIYIYICYISPRVMDPLVHHLDSKVEPTDEPID